MLTRLKPQDKEHLVEQDRALYVGLPRGEKSVDAALAQALLVRLWRLRIPIESVSPTSVFFESSGREKALQGLEGFNFTQNGKIIRPDIARYGAAKPPPKTVTYQMPGAVASSDEIVSALTGHILGGDKALPPVPSLRAYTVRNTCPITPYTVFIPATESRTKNCCSESADNPTIQ